MPYYRDTEGGLHFLENDEFEHLLPAGCMPITDAEAQQAPPPISAELTAYAAERRYALEVGGCDWNGRLVATDRDSQTKLIAEFASLTAGLRTEPSLWKFAGGAFVSLSNAEMSAVCMAARAHIAGAFALEAQALDAIAAGTITTAAEIDALFA